MQKSINEWACSIKYPISNNIAKFKKPLISAPFYLKHVLLDNFAFNTSSLIFLYSKFS